MLRELGFEDLDSLVQAAVPRNIQLDRDLNLPKAKSEMDALAELRAMSRKIRSRAHSSAVAIPIALHRRLFRETFWKTRAGTPLTHLIRLNSRKAGSRPSSTSNDDHRPNRAGDCQCFPVRRSHRRCRGHGACHAVVSTAKRSLWLTMPPANVSVVQTRAKPLGIEIKIGDYSRFRFDNTVFGALIQYPRHRWRNLRLYGFHKPGA